MIPRDLMRSEDAAWTAFVAAIRSVPPAGAEEPGYYPEWSVKDLMAHVGCWQAEAVQVLERIRMGTFRPERLDVDALNARFLDANHDVPLAVVRVECWGARTRMLQEMDALKEPNRTAEEWFVESGAEHYAEHLPRLLEWSRSLVGRDAV